MATVGADPRVLTQKLWSACKVLRDDGLSYGDYLEQLTCLLFLKMADERGQALPDGWDWASLVQRTGRELHDHLDALLRTLGAEPGLLGLVFGGARNRIRDPAKLEHVVHAVLAAETWSGDGVDLTGEVYEDLLERTAAEGKAGAGQYFTPRPLIRAIVECVDPQPDWTMADPACGTGGFLLARHEHDGGPVRGTELVEATARLCAMNLFLHGIDAPAALRVGDALAGPAPEPVDLVLANPPFGTSGAAIDDAPRPGHWAATSSKQLAFVQHVHALLRPGGRAAVVLPDNVLFEGVQAGSAGAVVRERLLAECDVHTILRLPTGVFYAPGVKANVVFLTRGRPTRDLWVYDLRTNVHVTQKTRPLTRGDLQGFVDAYAPGRPRAQRTESERFRRWSIDDVRRRPGFDLDLWAHVADSAVQDPATLPPPPVLADELADHLTGALQHARAAVAAPHPPDPAWPHRALGEVAEVLRGVSYAKGQDRAQPADDHVALLRHTNLQRAWELDDLKHVPAALVRPPQRIRAGDVVLTRSGTRRHLARALPATPAVEGFVVGAFLMLVRPGPDLHPAYLGLYLRRPDVQRALAATASGTTLCNLRADAVRALRLPVPPRAQQDRVVAQLEAQLAALGALHHALAESRRRAAELEARVLHAAFGAD